MELENLRYENEKLVHILKFKNEQTSLESLLGDQKQALMYMVVALWKLILSHRKPNMIDSKLSWN